MKFQNDSNSDGRTPTSPVLGDDSSATQRQEDSTSRSNTDYNEHFVVNRGSKSLSPFFFVSPMDFRDFAISGGRTQTRRVMRPGASELREGLPRAVSILRATHGTPNDSPLPQNRPTVSRNPPGSRNCAGFFSQYEVHTTRCHGQLHESRLF